jgi:hypothetical protein
MTLFLIYLIFSIMKMFRTALVACGLFAVLTLLASSVNAQSSYQFNQSFNIIASPAPSTADLDDLADYGPMVGTPCTGGNLFCGFSTDKTVPNNTVLQAIINRIKQEADNRIAAGTSPWLQHGATFSVTVAGVTYQITTLTRP